MYVAEVWLHNCVNCVCKYVAVCVDVAVCMCMYLLAPTMPCIGLVYNYSMHMPLFGRTKKYA